LFNVNTVLPFGGGAQPSARLRMIDSDASFRRLNGRNDGRCQNAGARCELLTRYRAEECYHTNLRVFRHNSDNAFRTQLIRLNEFAQIDAKMREHPKAVVQASFSDITSAIVII
jgi:hypothetical protein